MANLVEVADIADWYHQWNFQKQVVTIKRSWLIAIRTPTIDLDFCVLS